MSGPYVVRVVMRDGVARYLSALTEGKLTENGDWAKQFPSEDLARDAAIYHFGMNRRGMCVDIIDDNNPDWSAEI